MRPLYPSTDVPARARHALLAVAHHVLRDPEEETAAEVAERWGYSANWLRTLSERALDALVGGRPGPVPGAAAAATLARATAEEVEALRAENMALRKKLELGVEVTEARRDAFELQCFAAGVPLRRTAELAETAWGAAHRPRVADVAARRRAYGEAARSLLDRVLEVVGPAQDVVAADDVFFHGHAVKVVADPRTVAILDIGRHAGTAREDWGGWFEPYPNLDLVVSDLGGGLLGAAEDRGVPHQADFFHEMQWFEANVFAPLGRIADAARAEYWRVLEQATRVEGPGRRASPARVAEAERASHEADGHFFVAYNIVHRLRTLFDAVDPDTRRLWREERACAVLNEAIAHLAALPGTAPARAVRHLRTYGHRYFAWHSLFDTIEIHLRPGRQASSASFLDLLLACWELERQVEGRGPDSEETLLDLQRRLKRHRRYLRHTCKNLDDVERGMRQLLAYPRRSSSMVESLNSRLRVMQTTHRHVTDEMLALRAVAWNLTPRRDANRRGHRSPWEHLGVTVGVPGQPWYAVLRAELHRQREVVRQQAA